MSENTPYPAWPGYILISVLILLAIILVVGSVGDSMSMRLVKDQEVESVQREETNHGRT